MGNQPKAPLGSPSDMPMQLKPAIAFRSKSIQP